MEAPLPAVMQLAIVCKVHKVKGVHTQKFLPQVGCEVTLACSKESFPSCSSSPSTRRSIRNITRMGGRVD